MSIEEATGSLNSLTSSVTQATGSVTILQSVLRDFTSILPINDIRNLNIQYETLNRNLVVSTRQMDNLRSSVESLSKVTKHYRKILSVFCT